MDEPSVKYIRELYAGWKRDELPNYMHAMFDHIHFLLRELDEAEDVFADVRNMCNYILGNPPETQIKGVIDSYAFGIAHHQQVLNCERAGTTIGEDT